MKKQKWRRGPIGKLRKQVKSAARKRAEMKATKVKRKFSLVYGKGGMLQESMKAMKKKKKESFYARMVRRSTPRISLHDFDILDVLGRGSFGEVFLAAKKGTTELVALKRLNKAKLRQKRCSWKSIVNRIRTERNILQKLNNVWLTGLLYAFQDEDDLFMCTGFAQGGDLHRLLHSEQYHETPIPEKHTAFYIAELICALEAVHNNGFIHRDIKPANILLSETGHVLITDFGLSKPFSDRPVDEELTKRAKLRSKRRAWDEEVEGEQEYSYTKSSKLKRPPKKKKKKKTSRLRKNEKMTKLVGTVYYMAPEVIKGLGYSCECDYWSVGVVMYKMIYGRHPFRDDVNPSNPSVDVILDAILNHSSLVYPSRVPYASFSRAQVSTEAVDVMRNFLLCAGHKRAGLGVNKLQELKDHKWFRIHGLEWEKVERREQKPPWVPELDETLWIKDEGVEGVGRHIIVDFRYFQDFEPEEEEEEESEGETEEESESESESESEDESERSMEEMRRKQEGHRKTLVDFERMKAPEEFFVDFTFRGEQQQVKKKKKTNLKRIEKK